MNAETAHTDAPHALTDALVTAIALALHNHIPDWPGAFNEQLTAIAHDILKAHSRASTAGSDRQPSQQCQPTITATAKRMGRTHRNRQWLS
jgi:hypothetical protein